MDDAVDGPTGMLSAAALRQRTLELAHQSRRTGEPVGLIVGVLDEHGGSDGDSARPGPDAVLRDVAGAVLAHLRAFDLAYRAGEREFVVLLPAADCERAAQTAERLRAGVEAERLEGGRRATMSFGVSASREGWGFDYEVVRAEADAALGGAQGAGGNRVCGGPAGVRTWIGGG